MNEHDITARFEAIEKRLGLLEGMHSYASRDNLLTKNKKNKNIELVSRLVEDGFWSGNAVRTTIELQERLRIKFGKNISGKHAARDFLVISKSGILERDWIKPCSRLPKGGFIWFLPKTTQEKINAFKRLFENESEKSNN